MTEKKPNLDELIGNFIKEYKIEKNIHLESFTPMQIYYQLEPITDMFIEKANKIIESRNIENEDVKDEIESESQLESVDSEDFCSLNAAKAIEILEEENSEDEDEFYSENEVFTDEENDTKF